MRSLPPAMASFSPYSSSRPANGQVELLEHLVERRQVAEPFGVGEHTIAVEDQGGHQALPSLPNRRMWSSAMSTMSARTCLNSEGGSHVSVACASPRNARLDRM